MKFNFYDILSTTKEDNGSISAQLGDAIGKQVYYDDADIWQHVGFASRPSNYVDGDDDCAQAISIPDSDTDIVIATRDVRGQEIYGDLKEGETCLYATGTDGNGQARILLKDNGSVTMYTKKGNDPEGTGMAFIMDPTDDGSFQIIHPSGHGIIIDGDGIKLIAGEAGINMDKNGSITIAGAQMIQIDAPSIVNGVLQGQGGNIPDPVPGVPGNNSAVMAQALLDALSAAVATANSSVSPTDGGAAAFSALSSALQAITPLLIGSKTNLE